MADLKPGVDGGSSGADLPFALQRQVVFYRTTVIPGSIVVDRENRFLYLIDSNNSARRYGIGIAEECLKGGSLSRVTSKLEWPDWRPSGTDAAKDTQRTQTATLLAAAGRPGSPLGARAFLLDKPGLIIHGTNSPKTIGHLVASGCIRLVNDDVEDLYRRVSLETRVSSSVRQQAASLRRDHLPPNTRSISQPSNPAAASGRAEGFGGAEVRVGGGR